MPIRRSSHDGMVPLFTLDVWEHAYYIDYRNERPKFVTSVLVEHRELGFRRPKPRREGADGPSRSRATAREPEAQFFRWIARS